MQTESGENETSRGNFGHYCDHLASQVLSELGMNRDLRQQLKISRVDHVCVKVIKTWVNPIQVHLELLKVRIAHDADRNVLILLEQPHKSMHYLLPDLLTGVNLIVSVDQ